MSTEGKKETSKNTSLSRTGANYTAVVNFATIA